MSFLNTLGSVFGITSARNNGAGQKAVNAANTGNSQLYSDYQNAANTNNALSAQLANTNYMAGAQNVYNQQQNASQMLYNQAAGLAPSAAQLQMQAGLSNANNQVQSAALSNQGGLNPGATQRNLLNAQAQQDASIVSQGMAARAQEQAQQQQMYSAILGQMQQQQAQQGQFAYGQAQNNLNFQNQQANNALQFGQGVNQANMANSLGEVNQQAAATQAQAAALDHTISAAAGAASGGTGALGFLKGMGGK